MSLIGLFPTIIYDTILDTPKHIQHEMIEYVKRFYDAKKEFYKPPNFLGDYLGDSNISNKKEFFWLNEQISLHVKKYLEGIHVKYENSSLFAQKSWPIICPKNGGKVFKHIHKNSSLSVVFYLKVDKNSNGGNLIFYPPSNYSHLLIPVAYNLEDFYCSTHKPIENKLIIFPSTLEHEVSEYVGDTDRYSVSYDITIVSNDLNHNENHISNPNLWTKI
jgi:uncharacterized protein (TIGR02466 family)